MTIFLSALVLLVTGAGTEDPEYPLGKLRLPPMTEEGSPFRLVDLRYSFADQGSTVSSFETRVRVGAGSFLGGEVTGRRRGMFFDTQRIELGVAEEDGHYQIDSSLRAPRFLVAAHASQGENAWKLAGDGQVRLSNDLELLVSYARDFDRSRFEPPVATIPTTGEPPTPPPARELSAASAGLFYQRGNDLELHADARTARVRTEAAFDLDVLNYRLGSTWNLSPVELDSEVTYQKTSGALSSEEISISLGSDVRLSPHFLARASTRQLWEPGILRYQDEYRLGLTFFGRRYRFARRSEAASRLLELQKQANALGYNERRVYDVEGLRRFRERLGISSRRQELTGALDELYRAEVRDRNVPQLGFDVSFGGDAIAGVESRAYRAFFGVPWKMSLPWSRNEDSVEFLSAEVVLREDRYPAGILATSKSAGITVFLNREMDIRFRWERPGITPEDIARGSSVASRITVSYEYAFGR